MKTNSIIFAAAFAAVAGCTTTGTKEEPLAAKLDDGFFAEFAENPAPSKITTTLPLFEDWARERESQGGLTIAGNMPVVAFFCHVFHDNPSNIDKWMRQIEAFESAKLKDLFAAALYLADNEKSASAFERIQSLSAEDSVLRNLKTPLPKLDQLIEGEIESPEQLDYCWGSYEATGELDYALRVFEVAIRDSDERINGEEIFDMTILAARWSITSFMMNDSAVRAAVNERLRVAPDDMLYSFGGGLKRDVKMKIFEPDLLRRIKTIKEERDNQSSSSSSAER